MHHKANDGVVSLCDPSVVYVLYGTVCSGISSYCVLAYSHQQCSSYHTSRLSPHPLILDLLSTRHTVSKCLPLSAQNSSLLQVFLLLRFFLFSLADKTELTDRRPARVLEVFVNFGKVRLAFRRTMNVYLLTYFFHLRRSFAVVCTLR